MRCTPGHAELDRQNPDAVLAATSPCGAQRDASGAIEYYLRNCRACGSTLCIETEVAERIGASVVENTDHRSARLLDLDGR